MRIADGMSTDLVRVGPEHTLREAARMMVDHNVGSAVVIDPDGEGPGIITERDILRAVAAGNRVDEERVRDYLTADATTALPDSSLDWATDAMLRGGFRHLIVVDTDGEPVGMLSMRDIVRCTLGQAAAT